MTTLQALRTIDTLGASLASHGRESGNWTAQRSGDDIQRAVATVMAALRDCRNGGVALPRK